MTLRNGLVWYRIDTGYACFGVGIGPDGRVAEAAPIAGWARGRSWTDVSRYFREKKGADIAAL